MSAPARSSRSVVGRLSSSVTPSAGTAISADAPPDTGRAASRRRRTRRRRAPAPGVRPLRSPPSAADGRRRTISNGGGSPLRRPVGADDEAGADRAPPSTSPAAPAIAGAALPDGETGAAPSVDAGLRCVARARARRARPASTAAMPARTMARRSCRRSASGTCQCVCLGSDQAERPVTTSNFLRSELTSCGGVVLRGELFELAHDSS